MTTMAKCGGGLDKPTHHRVRWSTIKGDQTNATNIPIRAVLIVKSKMSSSSSTDLTVSDKSQTLSQQCLSISEVRSLREYQNTAELRRSVKILIDFIKDSEEENIRHWKEGLEAARAKRSSLIDPLEEADKHLQSLRSEWRKVDKLRQQEEIKKIEQSRNEEAERLLLEQLAESVSNGKEETSTEITDINELEFTLSLPEIKIRTVKSPGMSVRVYWKFEIIDPDKVSTELKIPDLKAIQSIVESLHEEAEKVVGEGSIRVYTEESEAVRRK